MKQQAAEPALEVVGLNVWRGARNVIGQVGEGKEAGLTLTLFPGEICILQAPNGWGKSTLLDALSGLIPSQSQVFRLGGSSIVNKKPWEIRKTGLSYVPSSGRLFPSFSIDDLDNLLGTPPPTLPVALPQSKPISHLSGGQLQKLKFSTIQRQSLPTILLCLDEPFNALDDKTCESLATQLTHMHHTCILIAVPTASSLE